MPTLTLEAPRWQDEAAALARLDEEELEKIAQTLVTEDDEPLDNFFTEKAERLITGPLYDSWRPMKDGQQRKFMAVANVGIYVTKKSQPLVPDMFLCLDKEAPENWHEKRHRCYLLWEFQGKVPEVVVEIVSNKIGNELTSKKRAYARLGAKYYVVLDVAQMLSRHKLRVFELGPDGRYRLRPDNTLPDLGLQLTLWRGVFEGRLALWLRWCDADGRLLLTGTEHAELQARRRVRETERAERETERAERETERAEREAERAEREALARQAAESALRQEQEDKARLLARLRALGIDPESL